MKSIVDFSLFYWLYWKTTTIVNQDMDRRYMYIGLENEDWSLSARLDENIEYTFLSIRTAPLKKKCQFRQIIWKFIDNLAEYSFT